ncbi:hypothetical protein ACHWQZ_G014726 [Mnemiopsis leidyi]
MPGSGNQTLGNGAVLMFSGRADGVRRSGVGIILSKKMKNSLISYTPVSDRVMTARLHSKHINISVTVVYAPTEDAEPSTKDAFYRELNDVQSELPAHDIKLVLGDFNARVGRDNEAHPGVIGTHSYHMESNDNGKRMLDFCAMHQLTIGGTLFEHKDIHKTTWKSPNGQTVTQIDHICISKRWSHSLLDVRSLHSENRPLEDKWKDLKEAICDVSFDVLGERSRKQKAEHLSKETKELLKERGEIKKLPSTDDNRSKYSRINGLVRQSCKKDDNSWAARVAEELEEAAKQGQQRDVWQKIRTKASHKPHKSLTQRILLSRGKMLEQLTA